MNKLLLVLFSLLVFHQKVQPISLSENIPDSVYIRAIDFYDESEDSSTIIEITYPKIFGLKNKSYEDKINSFLEEEFFKSVEFYEEFIAIQDSVPSLEYQSGMYFGFETGFDIKLVNESFISLVLNHYEFTGGAHGNFYSMGYSFDLNTGELLTLDKILKNNAISELTKICERKLLEMFTGETLSDAGMFEDYLELNFDQDFYLTSNALVLQFDPYEIAPYSMGNIEVIIPFEELEASLIYPFEFEE